MTVVYNATAEVSGAILTAVLTTIISFVPVFTMIGAEGKLFRPLAFTKTMALSASLVIALFLIPPFAAYLFRKTTLKKSFRYIINMLLLLGGIAIIYGYWLRFDFNCFWSYRFIRVKGKLEKKRVNLINIIISALQLYSYLLNIGDL